MSMKLCLGIIVLAGLIIGFNEKMYAKQKPINPGIRSVATKSINTIHGTMRKKGKNDIFKKSRFAVDEAFGLQGTNMYDNYGIEYHLAFNKGEDGIKKTKGTISGNVSEHCCSSSLVINENKSKYNNNNLEIFVTMPDGYVCGINNGACVSYMYKGKFVENKNGIRLIKGRWRNVVEDGTNVVGSGEFTMRPKGVSGIVTDGITKEPIKDAKVTLETKQYPENSNGFYQYDDVSVGSHTITASADGYQESQKSITVTGKERGIQVDFSLTPLTISTPQVISTSPGSDATGVDINSDITATFNNQMNEATINQDTFVVRNQWLKESTELLGGEYNSLAIDTSGNVHIGYQEATELELRYATNASNSWETTTVDGDGFDVGVGISLKLDTSGNAHISYLGDSDGLSIIKYATNVSGSWETTVVDNVRGIFTALALDKDGKAHISYNDSTNGNLKYATNVSGSWENEIVDGETEEVGESVSLALDKDGKAHISYNDSTNGNLKYATNVSGSWENEIVDGETEEVGESVSLALDKDGKAHISYNDSTNKNLKYATNVSGSWETTTVDGDGHVGSFTSLAMDTSDKVHISYYDYYEFTEEGNALTINLKYATNVSGQWIKETLDYSSGNEGEDETYKPISSIVLDNSDSVHISYGDGVYEGLYYTTNSPDKTKIIGAVTYDSENLKAIFTPPESGLEYNSKYIATITTGVNDLYGNAITSDYTWSFTTTAMSEAMFLRQNSVFGNETD